MMNKISIVALSLFVANAVLISHAGAVTLIQDDFSRTGALNGSSPSPVNLLNDTWLKVDGTSMTNSWNTNGSVLEYSVKANSSLSRSGVVNLAFTPVADTVYTLSTSVTLGQGDWIAMGFAGDTQGLYSQGANYLRYSTGGSVTAYNAPNLGGKLEPTASTASSTAELSIELNTSTMVATYYLDGSSFATGNISSLAGINNVFLEVRSSSGTLNTGSFDSFTLTQIPEQSTFSMLVIMGFIMLEIYKFRRRG